MANFPTSVFSPAARSNGQVIDASHVNSLQDEVTAIEDGFRNATAPLNSSKSTLVALNVTGGTTLATLSVSGNSTFGQINVTGQSSFTNRPSMPVPDMVILERNGTQHLTNNTTTAIAWETGQINSNSSMHSTAVNPSQVAPQSTGVYAIQANVLLSASLNQSTSELVVRLEDSSGAPIGIGQFVGDSSDDAAVSVSAVKRFQAAGGYVRTVVYVRDGSTASIKTVGTSMSMYKL